MLNKKPIFIVGFTRGGSNILLNLLRSHPQVCSPRGETQEVFKGKLKVESIPVLLSKWWNYLPILIAQRQHVFSLNLTTDPANAFSEKTMQRIDKILFYEKMKALDPTQNQYKNENEKYTLDEIKESRLLCKNLNGLIFVTGLFNKMYPDATFLALVRNGFAVCEGHLRRKIDIHKSAEMYRKSCERMIEDSKKISNYHILRFEDIINDPIKMLHKIYDYCDLDARLLKKIRLATKPIVKKDGSHGYVHGISETKLLWYDLEEFATHFDKNVNDNQIARLTEHQKKVIQNEAGEVLKYFNYMN
jgi:hypothetical protein